MSLSDLELLQLVEQAKERKRGPQGPAGVGIESIDQFEDNSFTIKLTTGEHKKIALPSAKDGAVGPQGIQGERGEPGPTGRAGRDGAKGSDGADGLPGRDGSFVDTGIVNTKGHLLLGLSTGEVIDAGKVVGPAGETGERGATGLPGAAGEDGAAVLSGPRTPQQADGKEGDHWIDISSAEFGFYKKDGNGWTKLANLRQPAKNPAVAVPVGGGSGGGQNEPGELQNTRTLPLINAGATLKEKAIQRELPPPVGDMKTQEDANLYFLELLKRDSVHVGDFPLDPPYNPGELWFCTLPDELTLYVYDGAVWAPAAPPVSLDGLEGSISDEFENIYKTIRRVEENAVPMGAIDSLSKDLDGLEQGLEREEEERKRVDINLQNQIDNLEPFDESEIKDQLQGLEDQDRRLQEGLENEIKNRLDEDAALTAEIQRVQYESQDADQRLLARINGLEIPEMPGDYDDSNLRELIENEVALRATGDAALNTKIDYVDGKVEATREDLEREKAIRLDEDDKLKTEFAQALERETEERKLVDTNLQNQIDNLESFDETEIKVQLQALEDKDNVLQENIDNEIANRLASDAALATDFAQALEREVEERKLVDTNLQNQIDNLEVEGVEVGVLNDLKDVDVSDVDVSGVSRKSTRYWEPSPDLEHDDINDDGPDWDYKFEHGSYADIIDENTPRRPQTLIAKGEKGRPVKKLLYYHAYGIDEQGLNLVPGFESISNGDPIRLEWKDSEGETIIEYATLKDFRATDHVWIKLIDGSDYETQECEIEIYESTRLANYLYEKRDLGEVSISSTVSIGPSVEAPPIKDEFDPIPFLGYDFNRKLWVAQDIDLAKIQYDQQRVDGQLATLEEEIELLAPSLDRGAWNYTTNPEPEEGEYTLIKEYLTEAQQKTQCNIAYSKCQEEAGDDVDKLAKCNREHSKCYEEVVKEPDKLVVTTDDWYQAIKIVFNDIDANGTIHAWKGIEPQYLIDVFNEEDDGFMVAKQKQDENKPNEFEITIQQARGLAHGKATVKIYKFGETEPTNYVRKDGDKMTGKLETTDRIWIRPGGKGANGGNNMLVVNQISSGGGSVVRFQQDAKDVFKIENNGNTNFTGKRAINIGDPSDRLDGINKQYFEGNAWLTGVSTELKIPQWKLTAPKPKGGMMTAFEVKDSKLHLYNVADPQASAHALNLGFADARYVSKAEQVAQKTPGRRFKFTQANYAEPAKGKFCYYVTTDGDTRKECIRFAAEDLDGFIQVHKSGPDVTLPSHSFVVFTCLEGEHKGETGMIRVTKTDYQPSNQCLSLLLFNFTQDSGHLPVHDVAYSITCPMW